MQHGETPLIPAALKRLRERGMNPLRAAILVAFVGAILWVFAPSLIALVIPEPPCVSAIRANPANPWINLGGSCDEAVRRRDAAIASSVPRMTILVVTLAGCAWVLAGMVKLKA